MNKDNKEYFPTDNYTISFWLSQQTDFSRYRSTEELLPEVDTVIIGSGYAGTSAAYHLLEQDPTAEIALYEARNICSGATGRNGGHIKPYCHRMYDKYCAMLGPKGAAEVVNSEWDHLWALKKLVDDYAIDCDFVLTRACDVYPYRNDPRLVKDMASYDNMIKNPDIYPELKRAIQIFRGDAAKIVSKNPTTDIAITYPAASAWPWKLMTTLLKKCVSKGLNLQANTMVSEVTQRDDGKWVVKTPRGETVCKNVVYATNGYTKALLSDFADAILPHKAQICRIVPTDKTNIPHLTNTYGIFSSLRDSDYLINRTDGSVVVGGQDDALFDFSKTGWEAVKEQLDNCDDSYVTESLKDFFNENYMAKRFTTWKNTPTEVSHYWSGILGFTKDSLPYVGEMDSIGKKNAFIVAGFHGHGMPRCLYAGKAVATCISTGKSIKEIPFTCPTGFFFSKERLEKKGHSHRDEMFEYVENRPVLSTDVFKSLSIN